jgi:anti-sigma B factor antagonist
VLAVAGELDVSNAKELRRRVDELLADGARGLILDLHGLAHVDSSGLAELIGAQQRCEERGGRLVLELDAPGLRRTLEVRGLDALFEIVPTRERAIAALAPQTG